MPYSREQLRAQRLDELNGCFTALLQDDSYLMQQVTNKHELQQYLIYYQTTLQQEVRHLHPRYNHVTPVVTALKALNDPGKKEQFAANLITFHDASQNSTFRPKTRVAAAGITALLALMAFGVVLAVLAAPATMGLSTVILIGLYGGWFGGSGAGCFAGIIRKNQNAPITQAKKAGEQLATFFRSQIPMVDKRKDEEDKDRLLDTPSSGR